MSDLPPPGYGFPPPDPNRPDPGQQDRDPNQPYSGQPYSGQPYSGQPYSGQQDPGQPGPGQPRPAWPGPDTPAWSGQQGQSWQGPYQSAPWPGGLPPYRPGEYSPPPSAWWPGGPNPAVADPLISPDYAGWWRRSTMIVRNHWRVLATLQALNAGASFVVLGLAAGVQAVWSHSLSQSPINTSDFALGRYFAGLGLTVVAAFLAALFGFLVQLATTHVTVSAAIGAPVSVAGALRGSLHRLLPLVGWTLLGGLIVLGGICACFLPAIYFIAVLYALPVIVMVEGRDAISRCFRLFNNNLGTSVSRIATIFGLSVAGYMVASLVGLLIDAAVGLNAGDGAIVTGSVARTAIQVAISAAVSVFTAPALVAAYADMRARVEPVSTATIAGQMFGA